MTTYKSASITNLDASPIVRDSAGEGATGDLRESGDYVTFVTSDAAPTIGKICRIPSTAKVKQVLLDNDALSTSTTMDFGVAWMDTGAPLYGQTTGNVASVTNPADGTIPQISSADNKLFGAAVAVSSANVGKDITTSSNYTLAKRNQPIWQVLGLAYDPGGYFDVYAKVVATVTAGGVVRVSVKWVES